MIEFPSLVSYQHGPQGLLDELFAALAATGPLVVGEAPLGVGDVYRMARSGHGGLLPPRELTLAESGPAVEFNQQTIAKLQQWLAEKQVVYGVNTGYGGTGIFNKGLDEDGLLRQQEVLLDGLLCGDRQEFLPPSLVRSAMLVRVVSNFVGVSALRREVMATFVRMLNEDVVPVVPLKGSLTASGDLVPLAYIAAALVDRDDERVEVFWRGERTTAAHALGALGIPRLRLAPKEGLALVNGTSVAAGAGCLAAVGALSAYFLSTLLTAFANCAVRGTLQSYHPFTAQVKPHAGQLFAGKMIFNLLHSVSDTLLPKDDLRGFAPAQEYRLWQLTYPFRCATQHLAPEFDTILRVWHDLGIEINSVSDNPLVLLDGSREFVVSGGNFLGSTVARDMDMLKLSLHSLARLVHAQFKFLVRGVEHMLSATENETVRERFIATHVIPLSAHPADNMGFQGAEIYMDALLSEMNQKVAPHSTTYLSAEKDNQAIVSMGLAAARSALDFSTDLNYCLAAHLLATCQAFDLTTLPPDMTRDHVSRRENAVIVNPRAEELGLLRPLYDYVRGECGIPVCFTHTRLHTYLEPLVRGIERLDLLSYLHARTIRPALESAAYDEHRCRR